MAALNNERVVQIDIIFLSAVLTKESIVFQSGVKFFFYLVTEFIAHLSLCLVPIFNVSLSEFQFILLISLRLGSPGWQNDKQFGKWFHKPSGFFWAPLQPYNSYMYSCIVLYFA